MDVFGSYCDYAFSRNPIIVSNDDWEQNDAAEGSFTVKYGNRQIFSGRFVPPLRVNVSDIVDAAASFLPYPPSSASPVVTIENHAAFEERKVLAEFKFGDNSGSVSRYVIPGGVSRQNFRFLTGQETDVFESRFFTKGNFFLSTRSSGWIIRIKESELFPLYFINPDQSEFSIEAVGSGKSYGFENPERVAALDIANLRKWFFDNHNVLPSVFDVWRDRAFSCRIVVEKSDAAKERYRLRFRNSFGVFEVIEITGEMRSASSFEDDESALFDRYDQATDDFVTERRRVKRGQSLTVSTAIKRTPELSFFADMLASEEVYLLDLFDSPAKVIPKVEDFNFAFRSLDPKPFTLSLDLCEAEEMIMRDISTDSQYERGRVFTSQFKNQFS